MNFRPPYRHLRRLVNQFKKLPGIGEKGAWRMSVYIATASPKLARELAKALISVTERMRICSLCYNLAEGDLCWICADDSRDRSKICVVQSVIDILHVEQIGVYKGLYHVLGGVISPWEGVTPEHLNISALMKRIEKGVEEVILGLSSTAEGEATSQYLYKILKEKVKVTKLAKGLPIGIEVEFLDDISLSEAFKRREEM